MKSLTVVIALGLAGGLLNAACAESFNERGEDFIASVKPDSRAQRQPVGVLLSGFNDRGYERGVVTHVASSKPSNDFRVTFRGFNNRGHVSLY